MVNSLRIPTALISSLLVHIALLMGMMHQVNIHLPDVEGLMQVTLYPSLNNSSAEALLQPVNKTLSISKPSDVKPKRTAQKVTSSADVVKPIPTAAENNHTSGHFRWRAPSNDPISDVMNALQREQITFQRQSQRQAQAAAIMEGLSTLSSQLHPLITASIDCTQEANDEITCLPEPQENERLLIIQFFQLAIQAHRLGITGNPVTMDFGDALEVSVLLR